MRKQKKKGFWRIDHHPELIHRRIKFFIKGVPIINLSFKKYKFLINLFNIILAKRTIEI